MVNKAFPIDFIRQIILQGLFEEKVKNNNLVGGDNEVNLFSFYEQLESNEEVDRYTELYRDLLEQQNRTDLIANGTILAPENPTITNLNQCTIIPMTFVTNLRCKLKDRDIMLESINNIIARFKGRKVDVAEFENGKLLMVGTIANNSVGIPKLNNGDFIGLQNVSSIANSTTFINNQISALYSNGINTTPTYPQWFYMGYQPVHGTKSMRVMYKANAEATTYLSITNDGTHQDIVFPPSSMNYKEWQVSISFDSIRVDEPRVLNGDDYCVISFGGSATLTDSSILMGNQLTKLGIQKKKIKASVDISIDDIVYWLEPLEMPSGANAGTQINQLLSNKFLTNTHTDSLTISNQYTFVLDTSISLIKQWFKYARYGTQADGVTITYVNGISPNMIYEIKEIWSCWGNVDVMSFKAKITETIDIENTESDTLSITIPFQLQGEND